MAFQERERGIFDDVDAGSVFHHIVNTVREPLLVLDTELRVRLANRSFYSTFQVLPQDTENHRIFDLGNRQWDIDRLRVLLERIIPEQISFDDFEVEHVFPMIGRKTMLLNGRKIVGKSAGTALILLAIEDITERRRLERERDEALEAREELVAVVSHEVKNPLASIAMSLDLIRKTLPAFDGALQISKLLEQIRTAANRMTRITNDLLDVTKIEAGLLPIKPAEVEISGLVDEVVGIFGPFAAEKAIQLETKLLQHPGSIACDRERIIQVLSNLLNNAIKFTAEGGSVRIEVDRVGHEVIFRVSDTGCGIPTDELQHVFERFWQAKHRQYLGSGLGLYIAKSIVDAHHGRIGVESRVGQGSMFFFALGGAAGAEAQKLDEIA